MVYSYTLQVDMWRSKVDKGCIDRIKAFSSPPLLVAQVMEMVLTLIGKRPVDESMR